MNSDISSSFPEYVILLFIFALYVLGVIVYVGLNLSSYFSKSIDQEFDEKFVRLRFNQFKHLLALHFTLTLLLIIQCGGILLGFLSLEFRVWMWRFIIFLQLLITLGSIYYTISYRKWAMLWSQGQRTKLPRFLR